MQLDTDKIDKIVLGSVFLDQRRALQVGSQTPGTDLHLLPVSTTVRQAERAS